MNPVKNHNMTVAIVLLLVVALVLGSVGIFIHGLFWLFIIGLVFLLVDIGIFFFNRGRRIGRGRG